MIESLRIAGLAIVEEAELDFGPGLCALTGETGAGKSIVLGALSLLAGARASADAVRDGCDEAVVEAVFRTERLPELEGELVARGLEIRDHELVVRRSVSRGGRSRAWVAGQLVPVATLGELFAGRLEISSQHDSQSLRRPERQGWLLDECAGLLDERHALAAGVARLRAIDGEIAALSEQARELERRRDFLAFQVQEIDEARLAPGELEELGAERGRLAHADRLREEGAAAVALVVGDPARADTPGAADLLGDAARRIAALARLDPGLAGLAERVAGLSADARDAALDLERRVEGVDADPARLAALEERLAAIDRLRRKYGGTVEEILRFRDDAAAELARLEGAGAREAELEKEREGLALGIAGQAQKLSRARAKAARTLGRAVEAGLRELAMPQARFEVALDPIEPPEGMPCGPAGLEAAEFRLAANAGESPRPLRRVASGGELSRSLLALRNALREADAGMVLVFDEVDAGIGGETADRVGRALAELATHHQILCITHLPQVAAFADVHLRVEKRTERGRTLARVDPVEGDARVDEIARMAGGAEVAEATRRHARHLLGRGRPPGGRRKRA